MCWFYNNRNRKGFTVIEIFIVVSVLAVVGATSVSYYMDYLEDAKKSVRIANEKQVNEAINRYYKDHMCYPKYEWKNDSIEDLGKRINRGLDGPLANYFLNKNISDILSEGSNYKGHDVYFLVSEPPKKGTTDNVDNSTATATWKQARNMRVETRDYLVHQVIISEADSGMDTTTFNNREDFYFPLKANSEPIGNTVSGYNTVAPDDDLDIKMVCIPPGTFVMGAPTTELGKKNNENAHNVTITKQFLISKFEITQKQYKKVMGTNPSSNQGEGKDFYPVENVTLENALEFCRRLNQDYSRLLPYGYEFDLPTEAQWEYACRAGTTKALNSNNDLTTVNDCQYLRELAWFQKNSGGKTHPVGQKKPNNWGLYDMHGNVEELIKDLRSKSFPKYPDGDAIDPLMTREMINEPDNRVERCHRGGGYNTTADRCRSASRQGSAMNAKAAHVGFRVVLVLVY